MKERADDLRHMQMSKVMRQIDDDLLTYGRKEAQEPVEAAVQTTWRTGSDDDIQPDIATEFSEDLLKEFKDFEDRIFEDIGDYRQKKPKYEPRKAPQDPIEAIFKD